MKILILEDEAIIAENIYQVLLQLEYDPLEPLSNVRDAINSIESHNPELLIMDISLQNGETSFDVADYLIRNKISIPYIFLTAHSEPQTIAKARQYKPAAYIVKPFTRENLFAAIEIATPLPGDATEDNTSETEAETDAIILKTGARRERILLKDIIYIQANGKYSELYTKSGKRLIRMSLSTFSTQFSTIRWLRVHKSYIINPSFVTSFANKWVYLDEVKIPVGRYFAPELEQWAANNGKSIR